MQSIPSVLAGPFSSKTQIHAALVLWHQSNHCDFKLEKSDRRRLVFCCVNPGCSFSLRFVVSITGALRPSRFAPHDCIQTSSAIASPPQLHPKLLAYLPGVELLPRALNNIPTKECFKGFLRTLSSRTSASSFHSAYRYVVARFGTTDEQQIKLVTAYSSALEAAGHFVKLSISDSTFVQFSVVYKAAFHAFQCFSWYVSVSGNSILPHSIDTPAALAFKSMARF
jgi:hypothetical protein